VNESQVFSVRKATPDGESPIGRQLMTEFQTNTFRNQAEDKENIHP
jgi:hypothetical protein